MLIQTLSKAILINLVCLAGLSMIFGIVYQLIYHEGIFRSLGFGLVYIELLLLIYHLLRILFGITYGVLSAVIVLIIFNSQPIEWLIISFIGLFLHRLLLSMNTYLSSNSF